MSSLVMTLANYLQNHHQKPDVELWEELAGDDEAFYEEFARVITNDDIPEADDEFDPESFDNYVNMEIAIDRHDDRPEFARVTKRLKDKDGLPIRTASENPILDAKGDQLGISDQSKPETV